MTKMANNDSSFKRDDTPATVDLARPDSRSELTLLKASESSSSMSNNHQSPAVSHVDAGSEVTPEQHVDKGKKAEAAEATTKPMKTTADRQTEEKESQKKGPADEGLVKESPADEGLVKEREQHTGEKDLQKESSSDKGHSVEKTCRQIGEELNKEGSTDERVAEEKTAVRRVRTLSDHGQREKNFPIFDQNLHDIWSFNGFNPIVSLLC
ncbi:hypothetical protein COOONC_05838 [Cooperia oncophora]